MLYAIRNLNWILLEVDNTDIPFLNMQFKFFVYACFLTLALVGTCQAQTASQCTPANSCEENSVKCNKVGKYYADLNRCDCTGTDYTGPDCLTPRGACQKNECVFGECAVNAKGEQSCTCDASVEIIKEYGYERDPSDTACSKFTSTASSSVAATPTHYGKCDMTLSVLVNENCTTTGENRTGCSNTLLSSYRYENGVIDGGTAIIVLSAPSTDFLLHLTGLDKFQIFGTDFYQTFNSTVYNSLLNGTNENQRFLFSDFDCYGAYNFTGASFEPEISLDYEKCTPNACDGEVSSCYIDPPPPGFVDTSPICVCSGNFTTPVLNATATPQTRLTNVCKSTTPTVCKNKGVPYYKSLKDTEQIDCDCNGIPMYDGPTCNVNRSICDARPCQNGGKCTVLASDPTTYTCDCVTPYIGAACQYAIVDFQNISAGTTDITPIEHLDARELEDITFYFRGLDADKNDFFFKSDGTRRINITVTMEICRDANCTIEGSKDQTDVEDYQPDHLYKFDFSIQNNLEDNETETIKFTISISDLPVAVVNRRDVQTLAEWEAQSNNTLNETQPFQYAMAKQADTCPENSCSFNGNCVVRFGVATCQCDAGWEGPSCAIPKSPPSKKDDMDWKIWGPVIGVGAAVVLFLVYAAIAKPAWIPGGGRQYRTL